jgi:DNA-binding transcriptional LysR family regulator
MRLRHMEIFEAIRRTGSLTDAAASLHVSQPAASKLLANAEAQLGFRLFDRVKGRLQATAEAEVLAPQIARLHSELTSVRRLALNLRQGQQGHLRVGCSPALGLGLLPAVVREVQQDQPHVTFDLRTHHSDELITGLLTRELDMIFTFDRSLHPGVKRMDIGHTELVHIGLPGPAGIKQLSDLQHRDFIALDARDPSGAALQQALVEAGVEVKIVAQAQTHYVAYALAEAGCGEAVVDLITGRAMLRPGMMLSRMAPRITLPISAMVGSATPLSKLHESFIDRVQAACRAGEFEEGATHLQR